MVKGPRGQGESTGEYPQSEGAVERLEVHCSASRTGQSTCCRSIVFETTLKAEAVGPLVS